MGYKGISLFDVLLSFIVYWPCYRPINLRMKVPPIILYKYLPETTPLSIVGLVIILAVIIGCDSSSHRGLDSYGEVPAFVLQDQKGREFTDAEITGKVTIANLVFTNCVDFCPVITKRMEKLQKELREANILGAEVILVSFTVDPEFDTQSVLMDYAKEVVIDHNAWRFLTGSRQMLRHVITDGFKLAFGETSNSAEHLHADGSIHVHEYDVAHSSRVVLIDSERTVRAYYDGAVEWDIDEVLRDVEHLLDL